jgi:hypothetical protein
VKSNFWVRFGLSGTFFTTFHSLLNLHRGMPEIRYFALLEEPAGGLRLQKSSGRIPMLSEEFLTFSASQEAAMNIRSTTWGTTAPIPFQPLTTFQVSSAFFDQVCLKASNNNFDSCWAPSRSMLPDESRLFYCSSWFPFSKRHSYHSLAPASISFSLCSNDDVQETEAPTCALGPTSDDPDGTSKHA